jgi:hypothetical protein
MRLSREQLFDLVELVGKAVSTARQRPVDASWLDEITPKWLQDRPKPKPPLKSPGNDEFGLFDGTPWSAQEDSERTDLSTVVPGAEDFAFSEPEKQKAKRNKNGYGDDVACQLWEIQRRVRFRLSTVTEALDDLRQLCDRLGQIRFITSGWATMVRSVIDRCCL